MDYGSCRTLQSIGSLEKYENYLLKIIRRYLQSAQVSLLSHSFTLVLSPELQSIQF
jgi:hypothetical protein